MPTSESDDLDAFRTRFASNLERVRNLVGIYDQLGEGISGHRSVRETDLLHAAVVLLHATTEDLLRSLAALLLPSAEHEVFARLRIPIAADGNPRADRITLAELATHRGHSVDDVIAQAIEEWLERKSFNNVGEVEAILVAIGFPLDRSKRYDRNMAAIMARRHLIVHRADRTTGANPGRADVQSIAKAPVVSWVRTIELFGRDLLSRIEERGMR